MNTLTFINRQLHNLYVNFGKHDTKNQFGLIFLSSIIPSLLFIVVRELTVSEREFIKVKNQPDPELRKTLEIEVNNVLLKKFIIFYISGLCFLIFCWYYIATFCAVFKNSQNDLFINSIISFALSAGLSFIIKLIPGFLRIPALKDKNSNTLYKVSTFISYF